MLNFWPFFLSAFLMITMPLVVAWLIWRRRRARWGLFFIGLAGFIISQIFHIPFNWLVVNQLELIPTDTAVLSSLILMSLFYGASAGFFEETTRYLTLRYWAKDARTWGRGMMHGAGWGGVESILVGLLMGINAVVLAAMSQGFLMELIPEAQRPLLDQQIAAMLAIPWYEAMLGALERAFAIILHLSFSLVVMQALVSGHFRWWWLAFLWHTLVNAVVVFAQFQWQNAYLTEGLVALFALGSLGMILWLRKPEPVEPAQEPLPPPPPVVAQDMPLDLDKLDNSKYS
jgi:uncharacterized membrane protein YhfC